MNYELLYKLAIEENDKLKSEVITLRKRNERLNLEVNKVESLIKNIQDEKEVFQNQIHSLKDEINLLKSALEFKEEEKQHYSHYS